MHFLQTKFWASFKSSHGWSCVEWNGINVLTRQFKKGPVHFTLAYTPMVSVEASGEDGKACTADGVAEALRLAAAGMKDMLPRDTLCIRSDAAVDFATCEERDAFVRALPRTVVKSRVDIQPPDTVLLDLVNDKGQAKTMEELLKAMKSKWRYNIRLAEKHGVSVAAYHKGDKGLQDAIDVFYGLYEETAARDRIAIHPKNYYGDLLNADTGDEGVVTLYVARHEEDNLAAIVTVFTKDEATYLYGASGGVKRNLMSTYLLQWTAIKDALSYGDKVYDFYGIPPMADKNHPMAGLYLFKTGFGGREVHRPGSIDVRISPCYGLYTMAERMRAFWYKKVRKAHSRARRAEGKR